MSCYATQNWFIEMATFLPRFHFAYNSFAYFKLLFCAGFFFSSTDTVHIYTVFLWLGEIIVMILQNWHNNHVVFAVMIFSPDQIFFIRFLCFFP